VVQRKRDFDPSAIRLISFDCYGTLIDWEQGILAALRVVLAAHGELPPPHELLESYAELEQAAESPPYRPYRQVLRTVIERLGSRNGFLPDEGELDTLVGSLPAWRPFEDTVPALRRLSARYRLAVCSNVDESLFEATARHLQVTFETVVTAEAVGAYKPAPAHFRELQRRSGLPPEAILHAAQSLYHDILPARAQGFATAWVHRPSVRPRFGATPTAQALPDLEVESLDALASRMGA
jgi:2-haloacid dehalogenase